MIMTGTHDRAAASRSKFTLANGTGYYKSVFLETPGENPEVSLSPQSFLVEQDADSVILPHFHLQNEFQVIVQGGGSLGRHPVQPLTVHYAGAHTGYGPITAGSDGLWYFTLRSRMDFGAKFLPEARSEMQKDVPKRHLLGAQVTLGGARQRTEATCEELFAPQPDGIGGWVAHLPPGRAMQAPVHPGGLGRFYVVADGSACIGAAGGGENLPRWATVFVTPEEEPVTLCAGSEGAAILVLQFPA
ncbi:MAG: hypothetical protein ABI630_00390 [Betaproteobacteria bacterium]